MYRFIVKPTFDWLAALLGLTISSPLILLVGVALFISNQGKVWFVQPRPGYRGKLFKIVKFRTMSDARDEKGNLLPDDARLTAVGRVVRKLSLDELPQLVNVLLGQMSIVGPRPLLVEYLPLYSDQQKRRHDVRPGVTGWAQVNGRNAISWNEKFALDCWYVDHISFWLDVKILLRTAVKVLKREGINASTMETMEKFRGNQSA